MRRSLLSLAVVGLSLVSVPGFAQIARTSILVINHPDTGAFLLSEVYPVTPLSFNDTGGGNPDQISDNACFIGRDQGESNVKVTPGVFCLGPTVDFRFNANAFATCPQGYGSPFVQSVRLIKHVPGSQKVPDCFPVQEFTQFGGGGIRTWWALKFTQPGTTFTLELTVVCQKTGAKRSIPTIHLDRWTWKVHATAVTLRLAINMLHSSALSTLEFPCIADEGVFFRLRAAVDRLRAATTRLEGQDAIFDLEGILFSECVFVDFVAPDFVRMDGLGFDVQKTPGNFPSGTDWVPNGDGNLDPNDPTKKGGILDTFENPCCCKLIADVEFISNDLGLSTR